MELPNKGMPAQSHSFIVEDSSHPERIDHYLAHQFPTYSRSFFKRLIDQHLISLNGQIILKSGAIIKKNDVIIMQFPPEPTPHIAYDKKDLPPVELIYTHEHFLIVC